MQYEVLVRLVGLLAKQTVSFTSLQARTSLHQVLHVQLEAAQKHG
jgi:hypothetical protein